jgi:hypothetical protein
MSEWDDRIRTHRVWQEMQSLGQSVDAANSVEGLSPETSAGIERVRTVLTYCGKRLAAADPMVTAPQPVDSIASHLSALQNELAAFVSDRSPGRVIAANQIADALVLSLTQIPGAYSSEELGALVAVSAQYRSTVHDALTTASTDIERFKSSSSDGLARLHAQLEDSSRDVTARLENMQASLAQLAAAIQSEQQRLSQILSDQQGQFSTAQEARGREFTESLRLANEGYTKLVAEYQSQFSAAQDSRSNENAAAESARQSKFNDTIADFSRKLAEQDLEFTKQRNGFVAASERDLATLVSEFGEKAAQVLEDIHEKQKYVEKLVGVIGNLGVTSGYLRVANQARWALWGWQGATVGALITLSWLAYRTLGALEGNGGHFNWGGFAARALLLVSLGVIAAYSGTQADKLFGEERRNRKLALELEAIGPYLAPLPVEEQNKFRLQIGELSFGREPESHIHRKSPASVIDLLNSKEAKELLKLLVEVGVKAKDLK